MKKATWWNDRDIEVIEIEGRFIALNGWNGEEYLDCWEVKEVSNGKAYGIKEDGLKVRPLYKENEGDFEITGYEFTY